jgi:hypothetical protein
MDIIADLTASINEHSAKGSSQDTTIGASNIMVTAIEKTNTAFGNFRFFLLIVTLICALIFGVAICIATNCCGASRLLQYLKEKFLTIWMMIRIIPNTIRLLFRFRDVIS